MKCAKCGFEEGERVQMISGLSGLESLLMHGNVEPWPYGCHFVSWEEVPTGTPLPNPNVRRVEAAS